MTNADHEELVQTTGAGLSRRSVLAGGVGVTVAATVAPHAATALPGGLEAAAATDPNLTLWYNQAAPDSAEGWEKNSLPIGNGTLGASVFGGVPQERLQFNEKTLWTGGPGVKGYNYGNWSAPRPGVLEALRKRIWAEGPIEKDAVVKAMGLPVESPRYRLFGAYQNFGDVRITLQHGGGQTGYRRHLDISTALAGVSYTVGGMTYTREYFASAVDDVIVGRLTASKAGSISLKVAVSTPTNRSRTSTAADGRITTRGTLTDNGLVHESQVRVIHTGGTRTDGSDGSITVSGADSVVLVLVAGTNYATTYPKYRGSDPAARLTETANKAVAKGYEALRTAHISDYQALFNRTKIDLGGSLPQTPTDDVLKAYQGGASKTERGLEQLFYQYGRYLLIGSSRPGGLPANLQGVWNVHDAPQWQSDYHLNINLQMNYWLAETTNLSALFEPFTTYVNRLREPGRVTAKQMYDVKNGWVAHWASNVWGWTGSWDVDAYFFPEAAAWLSIQLYDHYRFTQDKTFLREVAYPVMKEAAQFWQQNLRTDPRDKLLVAVPSRSPELGPNTAGTSMSQQIIWHLLGDTEQAAKALGDTSFASSAAATLAKLDRGLRVGKWGQLQEWKEDIDSKTEKHRHVSHMFGLHPGRNLSPVTTPTHANAARVSLEARGDDGTGWSKAWKINFWARLHDGDRSHKLLVDQLRSSTLPNLWDTHPPFQLDGNFGATAGMTEMLLQSQMAEAIDLLPALPSRWQSGKVDGLRARGAHTVGLTWAKGALSELALRPDHGGEVALRNPLLVGPVEVLDGSGVKVTSKLTAGILRFTAAAGKSYRVVPQLRTSITLTGTIAKGSTIKIAVESAASGSTSVAATQLSVAAPSGWTVTPTGGTSVRALGQGESVSTTFSVTIPSGAAAKTYVFSVAVKGAGWERKVPVTVKVP